MKKGSEENIRVLHYNQACARGDYRTENFLSRVHTTVQSQLETSYDRILFPD